MRIQIILFYLASLTYSACNAQNKPIGDSDNYTGAVYDTIYYSHSKYDKLENGCKIAKYILSKDDYSKFNESLENEPEKANIISNIFEKYTPKTYHLLPDLFESGKFHDPHALFTIVHQGQSYNFETNPNIYKVSKDNMVFPFRLKEETANATRTFRLKGMRAILQDYNGKEIDVMEGDFAILINSKEHLNMKEVDLIKIQLYNNFNDILEIIFKLE